MQPLPLHQRHHRHQKQKLCRQVDRRKVGEKGGVETALKRLCCVHNGGVGRGDGEPDEDECTKGEIMGVVWECGVLCGTSFTHVKSLCGAQ